MTSNLKRLCHWVVFCIPRRFGQDCMSVYEEHFPFRFPFIFNYLKMFCLFPQSDDNTSGYLLEQEKLWKHVHESQASICADALNCPKHAFKGVHVFITLWKQVNKALFFFCRIIVNAQIIFRVSFLMVNDARPITSCIASCYTNIQISKK